MYDTVNKNEQVNVRVKPELKADLESLAEFHGLTVSSYVHSILTRHVRHEREGTPEAFTTRGVKATSVKLAPVVAGIEPPTSRTIDEEDINEIRKRVGRQTVGVLKQKAK